MTDHGTCNRCHGHTTSPAQRWCKRCAGEIERELRDDPEFLREKAENDIDLDDYEPLDMVPR